MPLREAIVREIRRGALKQPWTTADLLKNRSLIKEFAISTLRTEPPNCSRSVEGLALGDGVHSEDYFFYIRMGIQSSKGPGRRPLQYVVREEAIPEFQLESVATPPRLTAAARRQEAPTLQETGATTSKPCIATILEELQGRAVQLVVAIKGGHSAGKLSGPDAWYQASYDALSNTGPPKSVADFVRLVAYAYSWLPTNRVSAHPTAASFSALRAAVAHVKATGTQAARRRMIAAAQGAISVSPMAVVTVSKVLHFWDPTLAPMYDVNVKRALARLPCTQLVDWFDPAAEVANYLHYWDLADRLINAAGKHPINSSGLGPMNYRLLDEILFQLGKAPASAPAPGGGRTSVSITKAPSVVAPGARRSTKMDLARAIFLDSHGQPRKVVIGRFMTEAGLSKAGAGTYYQLLRTQSDAKTGK